MFFLISILPPTLSWKLCSVCVCITCLLLGYGPRWQALQTWYQILWILQDLIKQYLQMCSKENLIRKQFLIKLKICLSHFDWVFCGVDFTEQPSHFQWFFIYKPTKECTLWNDNRAVYNRNGRYEEKVPRKSLQKPNLKILQESTKS